MNYFERHLGDYARAAGHLSMLEHGAYNLLLDRYYTTEQGIPEDQAHRVCRARTRDEKEAVDTVLREFFSFVDGVWINGRAEREITKMQAKVKAAQENGRRGGRPRQTHKEPSGLSVGSDFETQQKAPQTPDTSNQSPKKTGRERATRLPSDFTPADDWFAFCKSERPDLDPKKTFEKFRDYWTAKAGKDGAKLDWLATWRNWVREERATQRTGPTVVTEPAWRREQRERTAAAAPGVAARHTTFDMEAPNGTAVALG